MFGDDMAVFFEDADVCTRVRQGAPDLPFRGIVGVVSREAVQGYVVGDVRELRYATDSVELSPGDTVVHRAAAGDATYRVNAHPDLANDGQESVVRLAKALP